MEQLGLDLGFYQVKLSGKEKDVKFPSVIGYPSAIELQDADNDGETLENIVITDKDSTYYVGEKAIRDTKNSQLTFTTDKTDNKTDRVKFFASLGLALELNGRTKGDFHVVTGLPVDEFAGVEGLKEKLKENMEGKFKFDFQDKPLNVNVAQVTVIPQSAGAYYDYIMDRNGTIDEEKVNPKTVVIDIGYRTTDVVTMTNARYSPSESFSVITGVSDIHKEMRKRLMKKYRIQKDITEIDSVVRARKIYLGGNEVDITNDIIESVRPYAEKIISNLPLYISNMSEVHQIVVTGGGANLMIHYFTQEFDNEDKQDMERIPVEHLAASEYSNSRGYYKYAKFLAENGR